MTSVYLNPASDDLTMNKKLHFSNVIRAKDKKINGKRHQQYLSILMTSLVLSLTQQQSHKQLCVIITSQLKMMH